MTMGMQRIPLDQWAIVLFGAAVIVTGCADFEAEDPSAFELRDEDQAETQGAPESLLPPEMQPLQDIHEQLDVYPEQAPSEALEPEQRDVEARVIPDQYIVVLKPGSDGRAAAKAVQAAPEHVYNRVLSGFSGKLSRAQLEQLQERADVLTIEPDSVVTIANFDCPNRRPKVVTQTRSQGMPYGLDRVDQENLPLSASYSYSWDGTGVDVYVFDTGIDIKHPDFEGRAKATYDAFRNKKSAKFARDCHGHGTHVAGIIGSKTYGVAKNVTLHSIRVLDCNGEGSWSSMLAAMDWVADHAKGKSVANFSLSGSRSLLVDNAVEDLVDSGVVVVAAAGNKNADACKYSPARAPEALTVAANNSLDERASFSNYGSCVDMYSPGTNIRSTWLNGKNTTASGTSMATPHVAGVAALYLDANGGSPGEVAAALKAWASEGKISGNPANTPNRLIHWPCVY